MFNAHFVTLVLRPHSRSPIFHVTILHKCSHKLKIIARAWAYNKHKHYTYLLIYPASSSSISNLSSVWLYHKPSESIKIANSLDAADKMEQFSLFSANHYQRPRINAVQRLTSTITTHTHPYIYASGHIWECEYYRTIIIKYRDEAHFHVWMAYAVSYRIRIKCEITHENVH